ncbi:hypothetical protein GCM10010394_54510 [Streptomyces crystallinus]|uniref:Uncharacterized protein n=2 Tax=Streptomyces crystallinus TaxID=68191 RepID=A0ABP3RU76_9ACTN
MAVVTIALAADGRGWLDGVELAGDNARAAALAAVRRIATDRRRPVRVQATEPDGSVWHFMVGPDGILDAEQEHQALTDPDAHAVPPAYRAAVEAVVAAADGDQEHIAMLLAARLELRVMAEHGAGHPYVWRARELRAHLTYVYGKPGAACELYVEVARGWAECASDEYWAAAQRAHALWHATADERWRLVWLGNQLADLLRLAPDPERAMRALREVLRRVDEL